MVLVMETENLSFPHIMPPPLGAAGIMFSWCPSVRQTVGTNTARVTNWPIEFSTNPPFVRPSAKFPDIIENAKMEWPPIWHDVVSWPLSGMSRFWSFPQFWRNFLSQWNDLNDVLTVIILRVLERITIFRAWRYRRLELKNKIWYNGNTIFHCLWFSLCWSNCTYLMMILSYLLLCLPYLYRTNSTLFCQALFYPPFPYTASWRFLFGLDVYRYQWHEYDTSECTHIYKTILFQVP